MAEQVQAALDSMVAPLRDLLERGIFSQPEIQSIVKRRRESEYLLRRQVARKADFLRYIEAEMQLEKLRRLRKKRLNNRKDRKEMMKENKEMGSHEKKTKKKGGLPIGDVHIIQLIHFIFQRALRKFKSDISIHLQHAQFAKEVSSFNLLGRIYTEALQIHPRNIGLWIEAASFEFFGGPHGEGGGSIQSARVLMQRGIRVNPTAQPLWVQYFTLELHNLQKLRGRREILRISSGALSDEDPIFTEAPIPKVIFNNAVKAIPDDVAFRMKFLDACRMFPQTTKIEAMVQKSIEQDFQDKPEAWIARAMYIAAKLEETGDEDEIIGFLKAAAEANTDESGEQPTKRQRTSDPVLQILHEAIEEFPTADMYVQVIRFTRDYGERLDKIVESTKLIERVFESASDLFNTELVLEYSGYLVSKEKVDQAMDILTQFHLKEQTDVPVLLRLSQLLAMAGELGEAVKKLETALLKIPMYEADYTRVQLELFGVLLVNDTPETSEKLSSIFEKVLLLAPKEPLTFDSIFGVGSIAQACVAYLKYLQEKEANFIETIGQILERSRFLETATGKSSEDIETIIAFFELALVMTDNDTTLFANSKKKRIYLKRIYLKAMEFFKDCAPDVAESFRNQRDEKLIYR